MRWAVMSGLSVPLKDVIVEVMCVWGEGVTVFWGDCPSFVLSFLSVQAGATVVSIVAVQRRQRCGSRGARWCEYTGAREASVGVPLVIAVAV